MNITKILAVSYTHLDVYKRQCPYCGDEMIRGYRMCSRDITFAVDNLTKVFRIKKSDDRELSKGLGAVSYTHLAYSQRIKGDLALSLWRESLMIFLSLQSM